MPSKNNDDFITLLQSRFEKHMHRHKDINWTDVNKKLEASPKKLKVLTEMEATGGEPDVIGYDKKNE